MAGGIGKVKETSAQRDQACIFSYWDWAFGKQPMNASAWMVKDHRGSGQVCGEETEKMRKGKMTAVEYEEGRGNEKRKKLDGRTHSRNGRKPPWSALGSAVITLSWGNSFNQLY